MDKLSVARDRAQRLIDEHDRKMSAAAGGDHKLAILANDGDLAIGILRAALAQPAPDVADETGWLIEEHMGDVIHWIALAENEWPRYDIKTVVRRGDREVDEHKYRSPVTRVKDAGGALRFARKADADAFIKLFDRFLLSPTATEHQWPALTPAPQPAVSMDGNAAMVDAWEVLDERERCARIVERGLGKTATTLAREIRSGVAAAIRGGAE